MDEFLGRRPAIENARIALFQNHHAGALNPRITRIHGRRNEIGEAHVGDEPAALGHFQKRLSALRPVHDPDLAREHPGFDADKRNRLGQGEGAAPWRGARRRGGFAHVIRALFRSAAFMNRRQRQAPGQRPRCRTGVDPRQFISDQRQGQVLRTFQVAADLRIHVGRCDAGIVEILEQRVLFRRPFVAQAAACRHQPGHRTARHRAHRLHQHAEVVALGKTP